MLILLWEYKYMSYLYMSIIQKVSLNLTEVKAPPNFDFSWYVVSKSGWLNKNIGIFAFNIFFYLHAYNKYYDWNSKTHQLCKRKNIKRHRCKCFWLAILFWKTTDREKLTRLYASVGFNETHCAYNNINYEEKWLLFICLGSARKWIQR